MIKALTLQCASVLVLLLSPASATACIFLLLYGLNHGRALILVQSIVFLLFAVFALMVGITLQSFTNEHWLAAHLNRRRQQYAAELAMWRESLTDPTLQPDGSELILMTDAAVHALDLNVARTQRIAEMGLAVYRDPRPNGAYWIGQLNTAAPSHSWWWYSMHPYQPNEWRACAHEFMAELGGNREQPAAGKIMNNLYATLLGANHGAFEARLKLLRNRGADAKRDDLWLQHFIQTFGHADPRFITIMPEQVQWHDMHQILYHYPDWQSANDAHDMPQVMALRMYGLGKLLIDYSPHEMCSNSSIR